MSDQTMRIILRVRSFPPFLSSFSSRRLQLDIISSKQKEELRARLVAWLVGDEDLSNAITLRITSTLFRCCCSSSSCQNMYVKTTYIMIRMPEFTKNLPNYSTLTTNAINDKLSLAIKCYNVCQTVFNTGNMQVQVYGFVL
jgi:hypothetical protein